MFNTVYNCVYEAFSKQSALVWCTLTVPIAYIFRNKAFGIRLGVMNSLLAVICLTVRCQSIPAFYVGFSLSMIFLSFPIEWHQKKYNTDGVIVEMINWFNSRNIPILIVFTLALRFASIKLGIIY